MSCEILAALKPLLRRLWRTSASLAHTTFNLQSSSWAGPGILQAGGESSAERAVLAGRGCGSAFGKITFKPEIEDAYVNVFFNRLQPGKLIRTGAFRSHKARS